MEVVSGDNWSYKTCKAPVKSPPSTNQHPTFCRPDALPVAQPIMSEHWRVKSLILDLSVGLVYALTRPVQYDKIRRNKKKTTNKIESINNNFFFDTQSKKTAAGCVCICIVFATLYIGYIVLLYRHFNCCRFKHVRVTMAYLLMTYRWRTSGATTWRT